MRQFKQSVLLILFAIVSMATLSAQTGQYKLAYDAATQTYTVYGKVNTSYANPQSRFVNVFVTIMVPHSVGATKFLAANIQTNASLASSNVVTMSRLDAPSYNATKDYLFFNFDVGSANYTPQPITANTEFPIFSFTNSPNGCVGSINLLVHGDTDYNLAQANSINASNAFSILGAGGDTYASNYGTSPVVCSVIAPTVTATYTPNPMTAGQPATLNLTATNSAGNPAQSGMGYTYTLPAGLTIPAGSTPTNSCGGTATVTGNTVTFSGGSMTSGTASCVISVPVVAASQGTIDPATGAISNPVNVTPGANNGAGVSPTPIVINPPATPVITTAISPSPMTAGTPATLSITATNSAGNPAQSGLGYTYTVPTGLTIPAGSVPTNSCGGTATVSGNTVTFSGGSMASGTASCVVSVPVVAASAGTIDPGTGVISNPVKVVAGPNNGAGASPTPIVINPPACAANAGTLGY